MTCCRCVCVCVQCRCRVGVCTQWACVTQHVGTSPANPRAVAPPEGSPDPSTIPVARSIKHLSQALRALHMLINNNPGVEDEAIGRARQYIAPLIYLVETAEVVP